MSRPGLSKADLHILREGVRNVDPSHVALVDPRDIEAQLALMTANEFRTIANVLAEDDELLSAVVSSLSKDQVTAAFRQSSARGERSSELNHVVDSVLILDHESSEPASVVNQAVPPRAREALQAHLRSLYGTEGV